MSSTGRGAAREESDFYPTPSWAVHRLLEKCPLPGGHWLEPCAGDGSIIQAVPGARWSAIELREECQADLVQLVGEKNVSMGSFLEGTQFPDRDPFDVILTNPPYSLAQEFIEMALMRSRFVAMLLRLNYVGSEERCSFWQEFPPDIYSLPNRPSFCVFVRDHYLCGQCHKAANVREGSGTPYCNKCGIPCTFHGKKQTHSDSTEYSWFVWPEQRRRAKGSFMVLDPTPADVRKAVAKQLRAA